MRSPDQPELCGEPSRGLSTRQPRGWTRRTSPTALSTVVGGWEARIYICCRSFSYGFSDLGMSQGQLARKMQCFATGGRSDQRKLCFLPAKLFWRGSQGSGELVKIEEASNHLCGEGWGQFCLELGPRTALVFGDGFQSRVL